MNTINIINFQTLHIDNANVFMKPLEECNFSNDNAINIVIVRDPYAYFDDMLEKCISETMSPKLAKESRYKIKHLSSSEFLKWLDTLNYHPLINPQTFQLDMKKR